MAQTLLFNALREAIDEEMARDQTVYVLGEDVGQYGGSYKVTKDLYAKYGELRVLDTPIAENSFTGMAIGSALTGLRPIIEGMNMGFLLLAFNQISNNAGMLRYPSGGNFKIPLLLPGPAGFCHQFLSYHSHPFVPFFHPFPGFTLFPSSSPSHSYSFFTSALPLHLPLFFF